MEKAGQDEKKELSNIENELNKILELYDKKKIIIIPNTEKIDNNINDSNKEKKINYKIKIHLTKKKLIQNLIIILNIVEKSLKDLIIILFIQKKID